MVPRAGQGPGQGQGRGREELEALGFPENGLYRKVSDLPVQRKHLTSLGGVSANKNAMSLQLPNLLTAELTWPERLNYLEGPAQGALHLRRLHTLPFESPELVPSHVRPTAWSPAAPQQEPANVWGPL